MDKEQAIATLTDLIDKLEMNIIDINAFDFDNPRVESFICGAAGKIRQGIDDLGEAMAYVDKEES